MVLIIICKVFSWERHRSHELIYFLWLKPPRCLCGTQINQWDEEDIEVLASLIPSWCRASLRLMIWAVLQPGLSTDFCLSVFMGVGPRFRNDWDGRTRQWPAATISMEPGLHPAVSTKYAWVIFVLSFWWPLWPLKCLMGQTPWGGRWLFQITLCVWWPACQACKNRIQ